MLSNSSKYAIKAVLYLALNSSIDRKVMVKDISKPINVPQAYIAKLLQELSRQGIVSSTRGPKGGFFLSEDNRSQPVINIIIAIDGEKMIKTCQLSLNNCDEEKPCPLHKILDPSRSNLVENLRSNTINDLAVEITLGNAFLPL